MSLVAAVSATHDGNTKVRAPGPGLLRGAVSPAGFVDSHSAAMSHAIKVLPQRLFGKWGSISTMIETEVITVRVAR